MKFAFMVSGIAGFCAMAIAGYGADRPLDLALRDAAVGCLVTALVGRWFWKVLDRAFVETLQMRRKAAAEEEAVSQAATPGPTSVRTTSVRPANAPVPATDQR